MWKHVARYALQSQKHSKSALEKWPAPKIQENNQRKSFPNPAFRPLPVVKICWFEPNVTRDVLRSFSWWMLSSKLASNLPIVVGFA